MDNFTHSLAGWALGQAGLKVTTRKGLAALVLGANMPDIDVFLGWVPWAPLAMHRGFTHGLVGGIIVMPPLLAGLLWLLDRWQVRRGALFKSGLEMHVGWLLALAYIGAITHPLLDLQTTYSVQLLSPLSAAWYHADSLFIIDVWLWSLVAGPIAWSRWLEKRRTRSGGASGDGRSQAALGIVIVYIAFNIGLSQAATAAVQRRHPARDRDLRLAAAGAVLASRDELARGPRDRPRRVPAVRGRARLRANRCDPTVWTIR